MHTDRQYYSNVGLTGLSWRCSVLKMYIGFRSCLLNQQVDMGYFAGGPVGGAHVMHWRLVNYHDVWFIQETADEADVAFM